MAQVGVSAGHLQDIGTVQYNDDDSIYADLVMEPLWKLITKIEQEEPRAEISEDENFSHMSQSGFISVYSVSQLSLLFRYCLLV